MAITSAGIGSGLDINSIVTQLVAAERVPIDNLAAKSKSFNAKITALGQLQSGLSSLQSAVRNLTPTGLNKITATSSNTTLLSATTSGAAKSGTYAIEVIERALPHKLGTKAVASATDKFSVPNAEDPSTPIKTGTLSITINGVESVNLGAGEHSLQDIANAINATGTNLSGRIINNGSGYRLAISTLNTGAANKISITGTGALASLTYSPTADPSSQDTEQLQAPKDAKLSIEGMPVTRASNTISDAIDGVTLNLLNAAPGTQVNLVVAEDTGSAKNAVKAFVDAYNSLHTTLGKLTAYNSDTKTGAVLNGDVAARQITTALRTELSTQVSSNSGVKTLSEIGVSFQRDGTIALNESKLEKALAADYKDVARLFTATDGYATRLNKKITDMLATDGVIQSRTEGLRKNIVDVDKQTQRLEARIAQTEIRLRAQFSMLDVTLANMQNTNTYLAGQLSSLQSSNQ
ncbi:flagellar filament capping protein FliD [Noviherbaspirillum malthae]|uniref:flagellar filament capping protein FliD n=1 Tax=Noviherbaspirillum malthae TaxID=1260987 RepID=UPI00188E1408|nr:flagellar filament capping protein FliD [Noviherbaspirillum malthae]